MKKLTFCLAAIMIVSGALYLNSCKKDKKDHIISPVSAGQIRGKVILPTGTPFADNLQILSPVSESKVIDGNYVIDTSFNNNKNHLVLNANGELILMRYNSSQNSDYDITVESTALAMVMNTPLVQSLNEEGKRQLLNLLPTKPAFKALIAEISNSIKAGKSFADTNNVNLIQNYKKIIGEVDAKLIAFSKPSRGSESIKNSTGFDDPVGIYRNGRKITFVNRGVANYYVIGIYKNKTRVKKLVLDGINIFSASIGDIINPILFPDTTVSQQTYTLEGDGEFEIKIRSGRFDYPDGTIEFKEAIDENISQAYVNHILGILPIPPTCLNVGKQIAKDIFSSTRNYARLNQKKTFDHGNLLHELFTSSSTTIVEILEKCGNQNLAKSSNKYLTGYLSYLKFIKSVGFSGALLNYTTHLAHLNAARHSYDLCYSLQNDKITSCDNSVGEIIISDPIIGLYGSDHRAQRSTHIMCKMKISKNLMNMAGWRSFYPKVRGLTMSDGTFSMYNRTEDVNYYYYKVVQHISGGLGIPYTFQVVVPEYYINLYKIPYKIESNILSGVVPENLPILTK